MLFRTPPALLIAWAIALFAHHALPGDTVTSKDGQVLNGQVVSQTAEELVFSSSFVGVVTIKRSDIANLSIDTPMIQTVEEQEPFSIEEAFEQKLVDIQAPIMQEGDDQFDWIQLTSGEWLKGEIKAMYSYSLEFESDELDNQELDWEDISRIRTAKEYSVRVDRDTTRIGKLALKDGKLTIGDGSSNEIGQYDLISIAPEAKTELSNWDIKATVSASFRSGSSDQKDGMVRAVAQRRTTKRKFYLDMIANYSDTEGTITSRDLRMNAFFDSFLTKRIFFRPVSLEYYRDPIQNIKRRYTLSSNIGYYIIDNRKTVWDITTGPAYQRAEFINVLPGEERIEEDPGWVLTSHWDTELSKKLDWTGTVNLQYAKSSGGMTYHTLTSLEYELTKAIDLDISFLWDRIDDPTANELGETSKNDDVRITFGIGVEL